MVNSATQRNLPSGDLEQKREKKKTEFCRWHTKVVDFLRSFRSPNRDIKGESSHLFLNEFNDFKGPNYPGKRE